MAVVYLRAADGNDADSGLTWALAKATWASALSAAGNGGTVYIAKGHAEGFTGTITGGSSTIGNIIRCYAVDDTGDPEPPTTLVTKDSPIHPKFQFSTTADKLSGMFYLYGIEFYAEGASNVLLRPDATSDTIIIAEECWFNSVSTATASSWRLGGFNSVNKYNSVTLLNTNVTCKIDSSTTSAIYFEPGIRLMIRGGGLVGALGHSNGVMFGCYAVGDGSARLDVADFDCSAMTSGQQLFKHINKAGCHFELKRIKTPATFTMIAGSDFQSSIEAPFKIHGFGNGDTYYSFQEASAEGIAEESTAIYRDNGGTYDGTNGYSVKMTSTTSVVEGLQPLRFKIAELRLDLTSAKTLTAHIAQDAGTVLQDDEFWLEVEHPDSTDLALGQFVQTRIGLLDTPANLPASAETWTGDAGGADHRKASHTISAITGADNAAVTVWACLAKPSTTIYACPKIEVA